MARYGGLRTALRIAAGACSLAGAIAFAAAGPRSITTPDGAVVSVWEARPGGPDTDPRRQGSAIAYSVAGASATRLGLIEPTADAALDREPFLALDRAGSAVVVWSRVDGERRKIAYARLGEGGWTDFHYLTFGNSDDSAPRIATSDSGSYLFWTTGRNRYWYAPVELSGGRLLAAPQWLRFELGKRSGILGPQGGTDVPINIGKNGGSTPHNAGPGCGSSCASTQGGTDVPIVLGNNGTMGTTHQRGWLWGVASSEDCHNIILVAPDPSKTILLVFSFTGGATAELARVRVPAALPDGFAEATAGGYLATGCR